MARPLMKARNVVRIQKMRDEGMGWGPIGDELSMHPQTAKRILRDAGGDVSPVKRGPKVRHHSIAAVMHLHAQGETYQTISDLTGRSFDSIKSIVYRERRKLRLQKNRECDSGGGAS